MKPTAISDGYEHSLAIGSDGKLQRLGGNSNGQVGDGTTTDHDSPEAITLATGVTPTAIAAGGEHSLAIGSTGPGQGLSEAPVAAFRQCLPRSWREPDGPRAGDGLLVSARTIGQP